MLVEFKSTIRIDGHTYLPGTHEVSEELRGHWYLKASVINGRAFIRSEDPVMDQSSSDEIVDEKDSETDQPKSKPKKKSQKKKDE